MSIRAIALKYLKPEQLSRWLDGDGLGVGWHAPLEYFLEQVKDVPGFHLQQVKEKFGDLRIYWNIQDGGMDSTVNDAKLENLQAVVERWASRRCEKCGSEEKVGKTRGGWIKTQCFKCFSESKEDGSVLNLNVNLKRDGTIQED